MIVSIHWLYWASDCIDPVIVLIIIVLIQWLYGSSIDPVIVLIIIISIQSLYWSSHCIDTMILSLQWLYCVVTTFLYRTITPHVMDTLSTVPALYMRNPLITDSLTNMFRGGVITQYWKWQCSDHGFNFEPKPGTPHLALPGTAFNDMD